MWCSCKAFTNIWQQQLYKSRIWFWLENFKRNKRVEFQVWGSEGLRISLCLLEAVYMAPVNADPQAQGTHFAPQVSFSPITFEVRGTDCTGYVTSGFPAPNRTGLLYVKALGKSLNTSVWVHLTCDCHCFHCPIQSFKTRCPALCYLSNVIVYKVICLYLSLRNFWD